MADGKIKLSDAEKNHSTCMNEKAAESVTINKNGVKIVFIGNSITLHQIAPHLGWHNAWGMAASAEEKDYVHIVSREIEKRAGRKADIRVRSLATFERNFHHYDYSENQDFIDFEPDYLIIALGENVAELESIEEKHAFREAFKKLLAGFMQKNNPPTAVVRGVFWKNEWKDRMMQEAAEEYGAKFVKADFSSDPSMKAIGLFESKGVQAHPGDKGMAAIAQSIISAVFPD